MDAFKITCLKCGKEVTITNMKQVAYPSTTIQFNTDQDGGDYSLTCECGLMLDEYSGEPKTTQPQREPDPLSAAVHDYYDKRLVDRVKNQNAFLNARKK